MHSDDDLKYLGDPKQDDAARKELLDQYVTFAKDHDVSCGAETAVRLSGTDDRVLEQTCLGCGATMAERFADNELLGHTVLALAAEYATRRAPVQ